MIAQKAEQYKTHLHGNAILFLKQVVPFDTS